MAGEGGDIGDASVSALAHSGQQQVGQMAGRGHQHLDEIRVALPGLRQVGAGHAVAGIVHQPVDRDTALVDVGAQALRRRGIGQIGRQADGAHAVPVLQLAGKLL